MEIYLNTEDAKRLRALLLIGGLFPNVTGQIEKRLNECPCCERQLVDGKCRASSLRDTLVAPNCFCPR